MYLKQIAAEVLENYNEVVNDEEKLLYQCAKVDWLCEGDKNTAYFHKVVKSKNHMNRVLNIQNASGEVVEGDQMIHEFVNHFENFMGKSTPVDQLDSIGDIFSNTLNHDEAMDMIKEVTDNEIKAAMFDINDSKAPGPDGYTACFFKKAWSIVGNDVCLAIKEFFDSGKLLSEVNSTVIALIPKVSQPKFVNEFRPIACCNVLYKCISKILTNRIKGSQDKLVNLNQSAFIQGRSIHDNILLTQELLKGYNRKGGSKRCALKIDIAKAYDTVSWVFLKSILLKFGFHSVMVDWIIICISSSAFSICLNGEINGYFKGGRGLRQGDPISPYLFTLVMEIFTLIMAHKIKSAPKFKYHAGCKELKLTHLCFADDLLVLCHGSRESVSVIKESLEEFSKVSGLMASLEKSTIFFSNVTNGEQRSILNIVPFKVGVLPVKYLGVPLITKRLGKSECKQLLDKVKAKVNDWKNKFLSYAGRVQLIASVLGSMQIYWASVFLLPKSTVKDIEKVLKGFLWCQGDLSRGKAKIAWKTLCKPKIQGGLGFKDLGKWNEVLLTKHIWNIATHKESLWVKWVHMVKLRGQSFWEVNTEYNDSWNWKILLSLRDNAKQHIEFRIGNGRKVSVWYDKWCDIGPLSQLISRRDVYDARFDNKASVYDMVLDNQWIWNDVWGSKYPEITKILVPMLNEADDKALWRNKNGQLKSFSTRQVWEDYREDQPMVNWSNLIWFSQCIPIHSFVLWMAILGRLQTQDRLFQWNNDSNMRCSLCGQCMDSHDHLFFQCTFVSSVWEIIRGKSYIQSLRSNWKDNVEQMAAKTSNSIKNVMSRLLFGSMVYFIWQERNKRQFTSEKRSVPDLAAVITESVQMRLSGLKVLNSANVQKVAKDWEVKFKNIQSVMLPGSNAQS